MSLFYVLRKKNELLITAEQSFEIHGMYMCREFNEEILQIQYDFPWNNSEPIFWTQITAFDTILKDGQIQKLARFASIDFDFLEICKAAYVETGVSERLNIENSHYLS